MPRIILSHFRITGWAVGIGLLHAGCSGDDLLLPPDGTPAVLRAISGDGQTAPAGDPLLRPLVVEALDRVGRPIRGAAVVFEFVERAAGADISDAHTETDERGRASAEVRLGLTVGDQPVDARLGDASDLRVQFAITALRPDGGGNGDGDGDGNGKGKGKGHGGDGDDDD